MEIGQQDGAATELLSVLKNLLENQNEILAQRKGEVAEDKEAKEKRSYVQQRGSPVKRPS